MSHLPETTPYAQTWNASGYAAHGRFVAALASEVIALLNPQPGETILDAGCGDGAITEQFAKCGVLVRGVDLSSAMVAAAQARNLAVDEASLTHLPYREQFDAVFSNAALHWIPVGLQPLALASIYRALRPGGRFVAEMGGHGNIAAIRTAISATLQPHGLDAEALAASFFPAPSHYQQLLVSAGFHVERIALHPRPTPLPGNAAGMRLWLQTFRKGVLDHLKPTQRPKAIAEIIRLLTPILANPMDNTWSADYVRLRFLATRPMA